MRNYGGEVLVIPIGSIDDPMIRKLEAIVQDIVALRRGPLENVMLIAEGDVLDRIPRALQQVNRLPLSSKTLAAFLIKDSAK